MLEGDLLKTSLARQYHAGFAMLREAVERCPEDLWLDGSHRNAFRQIAYHTLFFTHLYLQPDEAAFRPWRGHQAEVQHPDGIAGGVDPDSPLPLLPQPYTREQVLEYCDLCDAMVEESLAEIELESGESGFYWYPIPKLEHQLVNLRHLQHGTAQLADRLRAALDVGVTWAGTAPRRSI